MQIVVLVFSVIGSGAEVNCAWPEETIDSQASTRTPLGPGISIIFVNDGFPVFKGFTPFYTLDPRLIKYYCRKKTRSKLKNSLCNNRMILEIKELALKGVAWMSVNLWNNSVFARDLRSIFNSCYDNVVWEIHGSSSYISYICIWEEKNNPFLELEEEILKEEKIFKNIFRPLFILSPCFTYYLLRNIKVVLKNVCTCNPGQTIWRSSKTGQD